MGSCARALLGQHRWELEGTRVSCWAENLLPQSHGSYMPGLEAGCKVSPVRLDVLELGVGCVGSSLHQGSAPASFKDAFV